ncbi:SGNH/GDSL hydrolase family protein [Rhizobium sp. CSW-27]|uniref:SGNH/GDSL hydrolase family protein n=1 Tax=Rhizobium sp. CSW-27 TaxID=2839985 RepID=UPI001C021E09|nr:SGNH/GDSL hydrolase family protein [Rhizobium sp. CSW-27]MBT9371191.1 SGNH/GDSL hydrolase family protein [Rhizobium sp. CSW-27]
MKTILAFGDSLTWGADPVTGLRHPPEFRWPTALEDRLGDGFDVISEGLGGRTTCFDDHTGPADRNGARSLEVALASHMPLDLVIIMLGTNDLKPVHGGRAEAAFSGMRRLAQIVDGFPYKPRNARPKLLIVAPPPCVPGPEGAPAGGRSIRESERLAPLFRMVAEESGAFFFDSGTVARASAADGVHLDAQASMAIGHALAQPVNSILA